MKHPLVTRRLQVVGSVHLTPRSSPEVFDCLSTRVHTCTHVILTAGASTRATSSNLLTTRRPVSYVCKDCAPLCARTVLLCVLLSRCRGEHCGIGKCLMPYATQYRKLTQCNKMLLQALSCTTAGLHVRNDWALLLYADCEQGAFDSYQTLRNRHKSPGGKRPPPPRH